MQGGRLKSALDDLYDAFQIYKSLSDKGRMEATAFSFADISVVWNELPYYKKALELLSELPSENKKVAEKTNEVKGKLGDASASQKSKRNRCSNDIQNALFRIKMHEF
jgi:hypothetical protein